MELFNIENIAFQIIGYQVSYVELIATLFGLISVWLASKANILTWHTGIVNEFFLFILFYQTQLYADMFLQVFFFSVTLTGWYNWRKKSVKNRILSISWTKRCQILIIIIICSLITGFFINNIHLYLPEYFPVRASYPFVDSLVMVSSIAATMLLAKKKVESWHLWIGVDIICTVLYFKKGIWFLSLEYFIFLCMAVYGLYHWQKQLKND
jgi:nicotinamide mononucleotide transporter